jgi:hypothetical protein
MHSIQLLYGNANQALRFEVPDTWTSIPTACNIQVEDNAGTEVLAATAATVGFTADTLASASAIGADELVLTTGASLVKGDRIYIAQGVTAAERATVLEYNSTSKTIKVSRPLNHAHAASAAVSALWFTYTYDVSTAATYPVGKELSINWVPNNNMVPPPQRAEVVKFAFAIQDLEKDFSGVYTQEYGLLDTNYMVVAEKAISEEKSAVAALGRDLDRLRDPELFKHVVMETICYIANKRSAGDSRVREMIEAMGRRDVLFERLKQPALWFDDDQDDILDEEEERPMYAPPGSRGYA